MDAPSEVVEVADGVFAYLQPPGGWFVNNTGFAVGRDGVVGIDTCATEERTRAYLRAVAAVSDRPLRTVVNTHHHGDHTFGNCFVPGATLVGHERCREEMLRAGPPATIAPLFDPVEWGDVTVMPPFLTFTDTITLYVDDLRCEVTHVGTPAHTTNDAYVWIPDRSVLFAGDLVVNGSTPFLLMGSVAGAITAAERVLSIGASTVVPGHGAVCGAQAVEDVLAYARFVDALARDAKAAGLSPLEAAREADLAAYAEWLEPERTVGNLHRAYAELDGAAPGAALDIRAATADMLAVNGGRPLTCHA